MKAVFAFVSSGLMIACGNAQSQCNGARWDSIMGYEETIRWNNGWIAIPDANTSWLTVSLTQTGHIDAEGYWTWEMDRETFGEALQTDSTKRTIWNDRFLLYETFGEYTELSVDEVAICARSAAGIPNEVVNKFSYEILPSRYSMSGSGTLIDKLVFAPGDSISIPFNYPPNTPYYLPSIPNSTFNYTQQDDSIEFSGQHSTQIRQVHISRAVPGRIANAFTLDGTCDLCQQLANAEFNRDCIGEFYLSTFAKNDEFFFYDSFRTSASADFNTFLFDPAAGPGTVGIQPTDFTVEVNRIEIEDQILLNNPSIYTFAPCIIDDVFLQQNSVENQQPTPNKFIEVHFEVTSYPDTGIPQTTKLSGGLFLDGSQSVSAVGTALPTPANIETTGNTHYDMIPSTNVISVPGGVHFTVKSYAASSYYDDATFDFNDDGNVDVADVLIGRSSFQLSAGFGDLDYRFILDYNFNGILDFSDEVSFRDFAIAESVWCVADANFDGVVNGLDFGQWINLYNTGSAFADSNLDGSVNGSDYGAWLSAYNATQNTNCP